MTRAKISQYSATANDNTDVNGVDIAEGCPPSSMNNMGREIMAALKRFQVGSDGDGVTVGGALVVSGATTIANTATLGNVDINGGTIDGTTIGGASAAAGTFTTLTASSPSVISVNSASDALRITQVGAGNALLVEDSANPDSTPFVIDAGGYIVSGATSTANIGGSSVNPPRISVYGTSGANGSDIALINTSSSGSVAGDIRHAKAPSSGIVANNNQLGNSRYFGFDGTSYIEAASIGAAVDGTPGTGDMPGRLVFSTTADGASTPTERMRINSAGVVGIGTTSLTGYAFRINSSVTGATTSYGNAYTGAVQSDVTSSASYYASFANTAAASFTLSSLNHYNALQGTFGAGSTVTNQYGFFASSGLTGATNNYGFYSNIASGSGRWNFYAAGTAANYMAGTLEVGSTIGVGDATPAASGAGITFPATQSASSDANTLDDYEEGTWTPTDTSGAGLTLTIGGTSVYVKIGKMVYATASVTYPSTANGSNASIGGLPFATSNYNSANGGGFGSTINYTNYTATHITMLLENNTTNALPHAAAAITNASLSTKVIRYTAIYEVA